MVYKQLKDTNKKNQDIKAKIYYMILKMIL